MLWRKLEPREFESGRHRAADERPSANAFRRLPGACRYDGLRALAGREIGPEPDALDRSLVARGDLECERRAGVEMPHLRRIDPMPVRALAAREQKIDRGRSRARAVDRASVPKSLAEVPAFGMRLEIEQADHVGG